VRRLFTAAILIFGALVCPVDGWADAVLSCDGITDLQVRAALSGAQSFIAKTWVERGPDWIAGYDSKAVARNPFAVSKDDSGGAAIHGYVWARDVTCSVGSGSDASHVSVVFTAGAVRFKEGKAGWTKPLRNGVLVALDLNQSDGNWVIADKSSEQSVLMPENILRHPELAELPKPESWPDKRCPVPKHWEGKECVAQHAGSITQ
jgi:hypothetical protein